MNKKLLVCLTAILCVILCSCITPMETDISLQEGTASVTDAESVDRTQTDPNSEETQAHTGTYDVTEGVRDTDSEPKDSDSIQDTSTDALVTDNTTSAESSSAIDTDKYESPSHSHGSAQSTAHLIMVGDILMHDPVLEGGKTDDGYSYEHLFANVADEISSADLALFNQEVIIAGERYGIQGYPRFNAPFELADALASVGFDVAVHATNHTLDVGKQALLDCLSNWETKYPQIEVVGMHDSAEDAEHISVIEKNGIKIAILNYTYTLNGAGSAAIARDPYLVDVLDENRIRRDTKRAGELADFIVVCAHWGTEYTHTPSASQKRWADIMLECGVDLVLGTHPHVIQPVEWLEDEDGNRMLVYWSLGNFVNSTGESGAGKGARMLGAMADIIIGKDADGKTFISEASAIPLITHIKYETYGITTYLFSEYTEQMLEQSEAKKKIDTTLTYKYCEDTFSRVLGDFIKK